MPRRIAPTDDGYTLAETLVALAVLALLMGGMVAAGRVIVRDQVASARIGDDASSLLRVREALAGVLDTARVGGALSIQGDAHHLTCGSAPPCGLVLNADRTPSVTVHTPSSLRRWRLPDGEFRLSYMTEAGSFARWPSERPGDGDLRDPLRRVLISDGRAVVSAPLPARPLPDCRYDLISRDCSPSSVP